MSHPPKAAKVSAAALVCLALAACTGTIAEAPPEPASPGAPAGGKGGPRGGAGGSAGAPVIRAPVEIPPLPTVGVPGTRFARLSHRQWENAVRDLLRLPSRPGLAARFRGDPSFGKFDNAGATLLVDEGLRRDYREAAEKLALDVTGNAEALKRILPASLPADGSARARAFIEGFGLRAYRRPLTAAETTRYLALFGKAPAAPGGDPFIAGARFVLEAFLQSPHFVYRVERAGSGGKSAEPLTPHERAAKLSFALVNSMPDDALLAAAAGNELASPDGVRRHAERLLATPAAADVLEDFHTQLLRLPTYEAIEKDKKAFPEFVSGIGADMRKETTLFARDVVASGGGLRELLVSPHTFVNGKLAPIYKVTPPADPAAYERRPLDPAERAGLLTQLGFLASNAHSNEIDSIHRGVFVHGQILCTDLPPPADGVSLSGAKGRTNRERITSVTGDGTCGAGCHSTVINPVGFAFEHYDALGRYRTTERNLPVNAAGSYAFDGEERPFRDGVEFSRLAAESRAAHDCYARHLYEYLHGRLPIDEDAPFWKALGARSLAGKAGTKALVIELVTSDDFLSRTP